MVREFDNGNEGRSDEPMGLPTDLLNNPAKYDGDIPLWKRTATFVRQYEAAKPKGKESLLEQMAGSVVKDPSAFVQILGNFDLVEQLQPTFDIGGVREALIVHAEQVVARRSNLGSWTPTKIEQLIRLSLDNKQPDVSESPAPRAPLSLQSLAGNLMGHPDAATEKAKPSPIERLTVALFNAPQTPEEAVDLQYNAAYAMVATTQPDVRAELLSILCYEKDWLPATSLQVMYFTYGGTGMSDDQHIAKHYSIANAREAMANFSSLEQDGKLPLNSRRVQDLDWRINQATQIWPLLMDRKKAQWLFDLHRRHGIRFEAIRSHFANDPIDRKHSQALANYQAGIRTNLSGAVKSLLEYEEMLAHLAWPYNLRHNPKEPLRKMVYEYLGSQIGRAMWEQRMVTRQNSEILTRQPVHLTDDFDLMVAAEGNNSSEQRSYFIRQVYNDLLARYQDSLRPNGDPHNIDIFQYARLFYAGHQTIFEADNRIHYAILRRLPEEEVGRLSSILEYYRPIILPEQLRPIREHTATLRDDIQNKFTRSVGRRGYAVSVTDPALRDMGYENIEFRQSHGQNIAVNIGIDGKVYSFTLDSGYRIMLGDDIRRFQNPQDQAWLELLTLSHLKKLVCTGEDDEELKAELLGGEKQLSHYRKQMVHKSEHLRHLPPGQKYSTNAWELCLRGHLPIKDLDRINRMRAQIGRGGTLETGMWTYVSGVEKDIDTQIAKPVKVAFAKASEDIRKVIDLKVVSQEELDRIEQEILKGLEVT